MLDDATRARNLAGIQAARRALHPEIPPHPPEPEPGNETQMAYEMELAAHRETTQRLLDEKDRRINALETELERTRAALRFLSGPMD